MNEISRVKSSKNIPISVYERLNREKKEKEAEKGVVERRIWEFKAVMECMLGFLEGRMPEVEKDFQVIRLSLDFDWERIYCLIRRECRRMEGGLPIYAFRGEILRRIYNQQVRFLDHSLSVVEGFGFFFLSSCPWCF